jgi:glycine cleavage system H protein
MARQQFNLIDHNRLKRFRARVGEIAVEGLHMGTFAPARNSTASLFINSLSLQTLRGSTTSPAAHGTVLVMSDHRFHDRARRLAMTVIIVLLTVIVFMTIDYFLGRRRAPAVAHESQAAAEPVLVASTAEPVWVAGYQLPEEMRYHPGHVWVRPLAADTVAIGMDDFARRLVGSAREMILPTAGDRLAAGQPAFRVVSDAGDADLVAPLTGEVLEVNPRLKGQPSLATDEPYGRGWLVKMRTRDLSSGLRNLMSGSLARRWTEDARERLDLQLVALSGSVLQDGGETVADFARHLSEEDRKRLVREFLLT